jgi:Restriction endonuclease XhoI
MSKQPSTLAGLQAHIPAAVKFYWRTRAQQLQKQRDAGGSDQGFRSAVTGGAQMDGFIELLTKLVTEAGIDRAHIFYDQSLELPGYFRPNKKWDFIVAVKGQLVAALEAKSQVGPSFGNNFNNRTEEAMGSALDLWTAFREKALAQKSGLGLAICFCLRIVRVLPVPSRLKNPILKFFPNFETHPTRNAMNYFVAVSFWSVTTMPLHS